MATEPIMPMLKDNIPEIGIRLENMIIGEEMIQIITEIIAGIEITMFVETMMEMSTRDIKTEIIGTMAKMTEEIIVETEIPAEPKMRIIMFKDPRMTKKSP